ncbi:hypothetical protein [Tsukamurella ocularis]|uniref:hypothetical protein n=1 Tax=Tsukamurella ocularis TaxID=1970234 RepID=UPI002167B5AF|nr:hypothetical protein [Tsukamurella ocularis]MCS3853346.1 hypothetical protein [Tsukamurella ocularis]
MTAMLTPEQTTADRAALHSLVEDMLPPSVMRRVLQEERAIGASLAVPRGVRAARAAGACAAIVGAWPVHTWLQGGTWAVTEQEQGTAQIVPRVMAAACGADWTFGVELFDRGDVDGSTGILVADVYLTSIAPPLTLSAVRAVLHQWTMTGPSLERPYFHWQR